MKAPTDALAAADAALEHAERVAVAYRRAPLDAERRAALEHVLSELTAARDPLIPYVRGSGRLYGGDSDPIRVKHRELVAAIRRVKSRLNQSNGTPYVRKPVRTPATRASRPAAAAEAYRSLTGTLAQYEDQLLRWIEDQDARRRIAGRGDGPAGMTTFREESRDLLDHVNAALVIVRERLALYDELLDALRADAQEAYDQRRGSYGRLRDIWIKHTEPSRAGSARRRATAFLASAGRLRASLYRASRRRRSYPHAEPPRTPRRPRGTWTDGAALAAVDAFQRQHDRLPTKRECNTLPELPPYTTLHRALRAAPLRQLGRLSDDNYKDEERAPK